MGDNIAAAIRGANRNMFFGGVLGTPISIGMGVFMLILAIGPWRDYRRSFAWAPVPVTIESVDYVPAPGSRGQIGHVACVYKYTVNNMEYHGNRAGVMFDGSEDAVIAKRYFAILEKCRKDNVPFMALVNPANPSESMLYRDDFGGFRFYGLLVGGVLFTLFPLGWWMIYLRSPLRKARRYSEG